MRRGRQDEVEQHGSKAAIATKVIGQFRAGQPGPWRGQILKMDGADLLPLGEG